MGEEHTRKDKEVTRDEIREREKVINGHSCMWIKMTGMGEDWNHRDRMRDSKITRSNNVANMYLLLKDRKKKLASRPVVSGCDSNTAGLSNMVSELLESVANSFTNPYEVISSKDMLSRVQDCNRALTRMRQEKMEKGESLSEEEEELFLIGSDVIALFPSLNLVRTGKIVTQQVEKSQIIIEGIDYMEVARYLVINKDKTSDLGELRRLLPWRKKKGGTEPGMKNKEVNKKEKNMQITWAFPKATPTEDEKRK
jgi:hypothetical protein